MGTMVRFAAANSQFKMTGATQKEGMRMRKFIYVVLISLTGLIGCVGMDGGKHQTDRSPRSVSTQTPAYEGTGVTDYTSEL